MCLAAGCRWGFDAYSVADGGGDGDALTQAAPLCTASWCWDKPPAADRLALRAISGSGPTDIWAVGDGGVIRRYDGSTWRTVASPTSDALLAIDVKSPDDVTVAAGAGVLWHFDGSAWTSLVAPGGVSVAALWRDPATSALWAAGEYGSVSIDNVAITPQPSRLAANALRGTSATNVWHAGEFNAVSRWTGSWTTVPIGDFPRAIWPLANGDALVGGGTLWRCTPATCTSAGVTTPSINGLWGTGDSDVWAVGYSGAFHHWNGSTWQTAAAPDAMIYFAAWGSSTTDIWAVGLAGAIAHYDGVAWTSQGNTTPPLTGAAALWAGADDDRWLIFDTALVHDDGNSSVPASLPSGAKPYDEIEGTSTDLYTLDSANGGLLHYDGASWTAEPGLVLANPATLAYSASEVIAANKSGQVMRKPAAGSWTMDVNQGGTEWHGACLSEQGTTLVVGRFGSAVQRVGAGGTWMMNNPPTGRFMTGCDFAGESAWAVGGDAVLTWVGGAWTLLSNVSSGRAFNDVLAVSPTEVYVAGGRLYRFDGSAWAEQALPVSTFIYKIVQGANGAVYAIGDQSGVLRLR